MRRRTLLEWIAFAESQIGLDRDEAELWAERRMAEQRKSDARAKQEGQLELVRDERKGPQLGPEEEWPEGFF